MFVVFAGTASDNSVGVDARADIFDSVDVAKERCEENLVSEHEVVQIAEVVGNSLVARWEWRQYGTGGNSGWCRI